MRHLCIKLILRRRIEFDIWSTEFYEMLEWHATTKAQSTVALVTPYTNIEELLHVKIQIFHKHKRIIAIVCTYAHTHGTHAHAHAERWETMVSRWRSHSASAWSRFFTSSFPSRTIRCMVRSLSWLDLPDVPSFRKIHNKTHRVPKVRMCLLDFVIR